MEDYLSVDDYLSEEDLLAGLGEIRAAPRDRGTLEMIVVRPGSNERRVPEKCEVSARLGLHGDHWALGCWKSLPDGAPHPEVQVTLMNSRCTSLVARCRSRWPLAGDNLYVDLDLSSENLPVGQRLTIGSAILQITAHPHTGCAKFVARYGRDAMLFVNSTVGKQLRLRGVYATVVQDGLLAVGDSITKVT